MRRPCSSHLTSLNVGARMLAEAEDVLDAGGARQLVEQLPARIVAVEQRRAARLEPFENLGLGRGDLVEVAEDGRDGRPRSA